VSIDKEYYRYSKAEGNMGRDLVVQNDREKLLRRAAQYARGSKSDNTKKAYRVAMADFRLFCHTHGYDALPATSETVVQYLAFIEQQKVNTIQVKLAAIAEAHRMAHLPDPTIDKDVKMVMAGIRREIGSPAEKKSPLLKDDLLEMIGALPDDLRGKRDKALLLVGFAGAFRRSELVNVMVHDIQFSRTGMVITLSRSKTDQEHHGMKKNIPSMKDKCICPVVALRQWLAESGITEGPVFRKIDRWDHVMRFGLTAQTVALVVKSAARRAGLDSEKFSGHSLRSGFVTSAFMANAPEWAIQKQTGHRSVSVLRSYNQDEGHGASNAARAALGESDE
jgi:integrase